LGDAGASQEAAFPPELANGANANQGFDEEDQSLREVHQGGQIAPAALNPTGMGGAAAFLGGLIFRDSLLRAVSDASRIPRTSYEDC
jgi:hypothetical protein